MNEKSEKPANWLKTFKVNWVRLQLYERFEYIISSILIFIISVIIVIAMIRLARNVFELLVLQVADPLEFQVFQTIFGMILTLLIALEFRHSIEGILEAKLHIVRVKTIILIALLALARKFIILDYKNTDAAQIAAIAFSAIALGVVYWLLKKHDQHNPNAH